MQRIVITNRTVQFAALVIASTLIAGCESAPTALEENFGSSVRHMIHMQTAQAKDRGTGMDGKKAEGVLEAYRADVAKPTNVEQEIIQIELGK